MVSPLTSNHLIADSWCDFPRCSHACWTRCNRNLGRWDGAPTNLWREVWRFLRRKPQQLELV